MKTMDRHTQLKDCIVRLISDSMSVVSPMDLEKDMLPEGSGSRKEIRRAVRDLVEEGVLEYSAHLGKTHLVLSFSRPVRLSERLSVSSRRCDGHSCEEKLIRINTGSSFGRGDHPTTQLCIRAIDDILSDVSASGKNIQSALDIGTGTGILAVAAAILGADHVDACDRDPISENEARINVRQNDLEDRISIITELDCSRRYDMIMANLRYPTLIDLFPTMVNMSNQGGFLIFSGIRKTEIETVHDVYLNDGTFKSIWSAQTRGWCGVVYKKTGKP